jgi:manganese/zinc/iron transport system permease protein
VEAWTTLASDYTVRTVAAAALLLGVTSGALGSFAVLRKQSLLGDVLSHAALPGVALGFLIAGGRSFAGILTGALATGVAAALLMLLLARRSRLKTDAALGIALGTFFAAGVVLLSYVQGRAGAGQAGLETFLFGQAAAVLRSDLALMAGIAAAALILVAAFWKEFAVTTFDPAFAASLGLPVVWLEAAMTAMIALAVVLGLQMVGVVLMSAMIVAPAVAARQWTDRLGPMVVLAATFGAIGGLAGALTSALARGLATGPLIVLALTALAAVSLAFAPRRGLVAALLRRRRERRALGERRVLEALDALARHHDDPAYPAEEGMLDAYLGTASRPTLARLLRRGAVRRARHRPDEGDHWRLSADGRREAAALRSTGPRGPDEEDRS